MDINFQKQAEQALIVRIIEEQVQILDVPFLQGAASQFKDQASRQEAMAALNPSHSQIGNEILRHRGIALDFLCQYVRALQEVDNLKGALAKEVVKKNINKVFV